MYSSGCWGRLEYDSTRQEFGAGDSFTPISLSCKAPVNTNITIRGYRLIIRNVVVSIPLKNPYARVALWASEIKEIGNRMSVVSVGENNGIFRGGLLLGKDTGATTGEIALGNAVGFLEINFNGEIIKIPYYGD